MSRSLMIFWSTQIHISRMTHARCGKYVAWGRDRMALSSSWSHIVNIRRAMVLAAVFTMVSGWLNSFAAVPNNGNVLNLTL